MLVFQVDLTPFYSPGRASELLIICATDKNPSGTNVASSLSPFTVKSLPSVSVCHAILSERKEKKRPCLKRKWQTCFQKM